MKNVTLLSFCMGILLITVEVLAFDLVKNGKAAEIVLSEKSENSSRLASKELSDYVEKMTGRKPAVREGQSSAPVQVVIGTLATVKDLPAELMKKLGSMKSKEACAILARGNRLWIIGKNEVAELYGTYHFMENKLGIRWLKTANANDSGEYVPKKAEIVLADYAEYREPFFFKRALDQCGSYGNVIPVNSKVWANRNGFQTPVPYDGAYSYNPKNRQQKERTDFYSARIPRYDQQLGGTHCTFTDPFMDKRRKLDTAFKEHPEYFALVDGKRKKGEQMCISNPEVQRLVADYIISRMKKNGGTGQFTFGMVDTPIGWCECDGCKALDGKDKRADFNEVSTRFYAAVQSIAKMVFEKYPDADLRTWAYAAYRKIPHGIKLDPRLKVQFTTHGRCWGHRLDDPKCLINADIWRQMLAWRKYHPTVLYTYEYFFCSNAYYTCVEEELANTLKLYKKHNITGWKEQAYFEDSKILRDKENRVDLYPSNWQMLYAAGKLLWNPDLDVKKLITEAESLYYGKAYPVMKKYHALRRFLWTNASPCMGYPRGNPRGAVLLNPPGAKEQLLKYLADAEKLAGNDKLLRFRIGEDRRWLKKWWIAPNDKLHSTAGKPFFAPKVNGKIVIDGSGSDKAWSKAFYTDEFSGWLGKWKGKPIPKELKTSVRILSDAENLYFLITAMEPRPEKLTTTEGRDSAVWSKDCIELFLYPPSVENTYYQIAVGPTGTVFDALQPPTRKDFNLDVEVKTKVLKDRYIVELCIPTKKLLKLKTGDTWKINIARDRAIKDELTNGGDSAFFTIGGVPQRDCTAFRPMVIGDPVGPVFRNGNFNTLRKLNPVQVKLMQKNSNAAVDDTMPLAWLFNGRNCKLEMCRNPDNAGDHYVKLTGGILYQLHFGKARFYRITFRAKGPGKMRLFAYRYHADEKRKPKYISTKILVPGLILGEDWKNYSYVFRKEFDDEVFAPAFKNLSGEVCLDDVVITEEADLQYHNYDGTKR